LAKWVVQISENAAEAQIIFTAGPITGNYKSLQKSGKYCRDDWIRTSLVQAFRRIT